MDDFTLIIQGKLNPVSIENIDNYLKSFNEIIISFWDNDDINIVKHLKGNPKITWICNNPNEIKDFWFNRQNIIFYKKSIRQNFRFYVFFTR